MPLWIELRWAGPVLSRTLQDMRVPISCAIARTNRPALVERQIAVWQPHLDWLAREKDIRLETTSGIVHVQQDDNELEKVRAIVDDRDDFALTGLHALTTGMGSVVLALAVAEGRLKAETRRAQACWTSFFKRNGGAKTPWRLSVGRNLPMSSYRPSGS